MKSKLKIRRVMLAALLVFATVAIGLQPFSTISPTDCGCQANAALAIETSDAPSSCCNASDGIQKLSPCCCNPDATVCKCVDCRCGEAETPSVPLPAIPGNKTTEVVAPTLICLAPSVCYPKQTQIMQTGFPQTVVEFTALSSQETCVLLSRFTC